MKSKSLVNDFIERARRGLVPEPAAPEKHKLKPLDHPTCGGVYFIQTAASENGPVKIGKAVNIAERLRGLQTAHPWPLKLLYYECIEDEAARQAREFQLHEHFRSIRMTGEWFNASIIRHLQGTK